MISCKKKKELKTQTKCKINKNWWRIAIAMGQKNDKGMVVISKNGETTTLETKVWFS